MMNKTATPFKVQYPTPQDELITPCELRLSYPEPFAYKCKALWDTGASITCINSSVFKKIGVGPIDRMDMASVTNTFSAEIYGVGVWFSHSVFVDTVRVAKVNFFENNYEVIVGADIMQKGILKIDKFQSLSFSLE